MALVIDDHLLLDLLSEDLSGKLAEAVSESAVHDGQLVLPGGERSRAGVVRLVEGAATADRGPLGRA